MLNRQREIVYSIRNDVLLEDDPGKILLELVEEEVDERLATIPENEYKANMLDDMPEFESLVASWINVTFPLNLSAEEFVGKGEDGSRNLLIEKIHQAYEGKRKLENPDQIHWPRTLCGGQCGRCSLAGSPH